jgi:hypothetical protein
VQERQLRNYTRKSSTESAQERQHRKNIKKCNTISTTAFEVCKKGSTRIIKKGSAGAGVK